MMNTLLISFATVLASVGFQEPTWKEYSPPKSGCSALFPGKPTDQVEKATQNNTELEIHASTYESEEGSYVIMYNDIPEEFLKEGQIKLFLDGVRIGFVGSVKGKLLEEKSISLDKNPGRDIRLEIEDGSRVIRNRYFLVKKRLYQAITVTSKENADSKNVKKFLDSFKFVKKS